MNNKISHRIVLIVIMACIMMAYVDAVVSPGYFVKSMIKLAFFLVIPIIFSVLNRTISLREYMRIEKRALVFPALLGLAVYLFILGAYYVIGPYFDFSNVTTALSDNYGVEKDNFLFVALYISLINSLLEEFFFRGFAFLTLKKLSGRRFAYIFSAAVFSLYHVAIMSDWFHPFLFILLILSLFIAGLFFNWLNEKRGTIYTSWLVHMCANFAINTVGCILFGII